MMDRERERLGAVQPRSTESGVAAAPLPQCQGKDLLSVHVTGPTSQTRDREFEVSEVSSWSSTTFFFLSPPCSFFLIANRWLDFTTRTLFRRWLAYISSRNQYGPVVLLQVSPTYVLCDYTMFISSSYLAVVAAFAFVTLSLGMLLESFALYQADIRRVGQQAVSFMFPSWLRSIHD